VRKRSTGYGRSMRRIWAAMRGAPLWARRMARFERPCITSWGMNEFYHECKEIGRKMQLAHPWDEAAKAAYHAKWDD